MEKKLNIWANIKWLWGFSPITWLIIFSVFIIILTGLIFGGLIAFATGGFLVIIWAGGIPAHLIWKDSGCDIKEHARNWWKERP